MNESRSLELLAVRAVTRDYLFPAGNLVVGGDAKDSRQLAWCTGTQGTVRYAWHCMQRDNAASHQQPSLRQGDAGHDSLFIDTSQY
jgi:hypothetical protein